MVQHQLVVLIPHISTNVKPFIQAKNDEPDDIKIAPNYNKFKSRIRSAKRFKSSIYQVNFTEAF